MSGIVIEQALFHAGSASAPLARSPGFQDAWLPEVQRILAGFGERLTGVPCPAALFVQPLGKKHIAIVQVADQPGRDEKFLAFRFLVIERKAYESQLGDPFIIADRLAPDWEKRGDLATLTWIDLPLPARSVAQIQAVLKRVKAHALKEGDDPESLDFERTPENSESPALLGGAQILVDGGKLVFERKTPDNDLVRGLWTLLPNRTRGRLYPATFAYSGALQFDVMVLPRLNLLERLEGYATEDMACEYPGSGYELALQRAAEHNDQASLNSLLQRRDSKETLKLAGILLVGLVAIVFFFNVFFAPTLDPVERRLKAAEVAGFVAVQDPWAMIGIRLHGYYLWGGNVQRPPGPAPMDPAERRLKTAEVAAFVVVQDPWTMAGIRLHGRAMWSNADKAAKK